jgi:hypothetical protein
VMGRLALAALLAVLAAGLTSAVASSASRSGTPNRERVRPNPADQAAARAAVLRRADLGAGWSGGTRKPAPPSPITCPGYAPKQSDLVLTGAAEAQFQHTGLVLQSDAQVLKTRAMVARDWRRSVTDPRAAACLRHTLLKQLPSSERLVSFEKRAFPRLAHYAAAYRMLVKVQAQGQSVLVVIDIVLVGRSRTELTLTTSAPAAARSAISAAEVRVARALLSRVRA